MAQRWEERKLAVLANVYLAIQKRYDNKAKDERKAAKALKKESHRRAREIVQVGPLYKEIASQEW